MNFMNLLEQEVHFNSFKNIRILIVCKKDLKEIVELKKKLRELTHIYDDFHKRNNGFYNDKCEIFFSGRFEDISPFGTLSLFVDNENEAKELKDDILLFINKLYIKEIYYVVGKDFDINKLELNEYEKLYEFKKRNEKGLFPTLYKNEGDAIDFIKENIFDAIKNKEQEIAQLRLTLSKYM